MNNKLNFAQAYRTPDEVSIVDLTTQRAAKSRAGGVAASILAVATSIAAFNAPTYAADTCEGRLYVANTFSHDVSVIDTSTNDLITKIPVGLFPGWAVFSPDHTQLFISNSLSGTISVIDIDSNKVVRTIAVGKQPLGFAITPDGTRLVVGYIPGTVQIVNIKTGELGKPITVGVDTEQVKITPDGKYAYALSTIKGLHKIDLATGQLVTTIPILAPNGFPVPYSYNLLLTPKGDSIYVSSLAAGFVSEVDTRTDTVVRAFAAPGATGLQLSKDLTKLYATNIFGASAQVYDLETGQLLHDTGPTDIKIPSNIVLSADGNYLYFGQTFGPKVLVLNATTWQQVETLVVGPGPNAMAICDSASPR
jgi:YVTN family beta-propeller protein